MDIGPRLRIARESIGYTLREASQESYIGESSISEFENSRREPKFSQLSRLAEVYKRPIDFFLTNKPIVEDMMLWRNAPSTDQEMRTTEAEFRLLCQQYHSLEVLMGEAMRPKVPQPDADKLDEFNFQQAASFAGKVQKQLCLGDIPSSSLRQVLEEKFYVKIFHLEFSGSAISTVSEEFGLAILLNKSSKLWRRNFDLAHELFHLLTWQIFRKADLPIQKPSEFEEKLANAFASTVLLPADGVKAKVDSVRQEGKVSPEKLDEIAREFGVSFDALLWRLVCLYNISGTKIEEYIERYKSSNIEALRPPRESDTPDKLPERYCSLAIRAFRNGKLSAMQLAKYMDLSYKQTQKYLTEEQEFTDEKISISTA